MAHQTTHGTSRPDQTHGHALSIYGHVGMDYGSDHHHKPTKAIIGVAIMVVLGFLTYELKGKSADQHSSSVQMDQKPTHVTVASSAH
jgi:hypothetical protein